MRITPDCVRIDFGTSLHLLKKRRRGTMLACPAQKLHFRAMAERLVPFADHYWGRVTDTRGAGRRAVGYPSGLVVLNTGEAMHPFMIACLVRE